MFILKKQINTFLLISIFLFSSGCARKFAIASNGKSIKIDDSPSLFENFSTAIVPIILIGGYMLYANKCAETGNCK